MAYGAYLAAKDAGRTGDIRFLGIDAIPDEGGQWVKDGALTATFAYPPPGAEGVRQALKILGKEKVERSINLPTQVVDRSTVDAYLKEHR
jgi:ribose transport system substrate-binding protein